MYNQHRPAVCAFILCLVCFLSGCATTGGTGTTGDGFVPLFDGQTLDGWTKVGGNATYHVEGGEIVGVCDNSRPNTFLRTDKAYADFEFRCQFKWDVQGNSGIQYRSHQKPNGQGEEVGQVYGYQFELDPSERAWTGGLYEEGRRGWLQNLEGEENRAKREAVKLEGWNDVVIRCVGRRIQTWLNGVAIVDYTDNDDSVLMEGFFALQVHSGGSGQIRWRDLRVKELGGAASD